MQGPDEQGWWRLDVDEAGPGTDYGYMMDDDEEVLSGSAFAMAAAWRAWDVAPVRSECVRVERCADFRRLRWRAA